MKSPTKKKSNGVNGSPTPQSGGRVACWQVSVGQAGAGHHQATDPGCGGNQAHPAATARNSTGDELELGLLENVPLRPVPGYADDGYIDVRLLGSEPIGIQTGKNGAQKQKFLCAKCNKKRWIIDSDASCASEMTRFTLCSFCSVSARADRRINESNSALLLELQGLQDRVDMRLSSFETRLSELESKQLRPVSDPRPSVVEERSPGQLRTEFNDLREHLNSEISRMRSLVAPHREPSRVSTEVRRSVGGVSEVEMASVGSPGVLSGRSPGAESFIADAYRRVILSNGDRVSDPPPSPRLPRAAPVERTADEVVRTVTATRTRRTRKRKNRSGNPRNGTQPAGSTRSSPDTLLVGDSLVGRLTAKLFTGTSSGNFCTSLPGAGVREVTEDIRKLEPAPQNTLIVSVGGNDFFRRDKKAADIGALMRSYDTLLNLARSKTGRCVVVGLIPRMYYNSRAYEAARDVNGKLADKCRKLGFKFVDPWDTFYGYDRFYRKDGIHFTDQGSRTFARMLSQNHYGPQRSRRPRRRRRRANTLLLPGQQARQQDRPVAEAPRQQTRQRPTGDAESVAVAVREMVNIARENAPDRTGAARAETGKRQRSKSPAQDASPTAKSPRQKRRRASEGDRPDPNSPPPRRNPSPRISSSQPSGNGRPPERA